MVGDGEKEGGKEKNKPAVNMFALFQMCVAAGGIRLWVISVGQVTAKMPYILSDW